MLNDDRVDGIFTLKSPSNRTFRIDAADVTFENGEQVFARLETNGASNTTNGRKIYISCPGAGTLKLGAYATGSGRGYVIEKEDGVALYSTESSLTPVTSETGNYPIYSYSITEAGTIVVNPNGGIYYGLIEFVESGTNGINDAAADNGAVVATEYYNITGTKVSENTVGLILKKLTYENGTTEVVKTIVRK